MMPAHARLCTSGRTGSPSQALHRPLLLLLLLCALSSTQLHSQPTANLIGHWPFTGNANDASGNNQNGTVNGATLTYDRFGNANRAYAFDGVDDYIDVPSSSGLDLDVSTGMSFSFWLKTCGPYPATNVSFGLFGRSSSSTPGWAIFLESYQHPAFYVVRGTGIFRPFVANSDGGAATSVADSRWHHVVVVVTDSVTFYIDGQREHTGYRPDFWGTDFSQGISLRFGIAMSALTFNEAWFHGVLDDIRIYDRDLTASEAQALYTEGGWAGNATRGTVDLQVTPLTPLEICAGESVQLQVSHDGDGLLWSTTAGVVDPAAPVVTISPEVTTTYYLRGYREFSPSPCADTVESFDTVTVTVHEPPSAVAGDAQYSCVSGTARLGGETTGGLPPYRWEWSPTEGLDDPTIEQPLFAVDRTQTFRVIVTDARGCRDTASVTVNLLPKPVIDLGDDTVYYCRGTNGVLIGAEAGESNPPYTYLWSPSDNLDRVDSAFVLASPIEPTTYFVQVTDVADCHAFDSVTVIPVDLPDVEVGRDTALCSGESGRIGGESAPGITYQWSPTDGLTSPTAAQTDASPTTTTVYHVTATDPRTRCVAVDSVRVEVYDGKVSADRTSLDFGLLEPCVADSTIVVRITNSGTTAVRLDGWSSQSPAFLLLDGSFDLGPGESKDIQVRYAPPGTGLHEGGMVLRFEPCGLEVTIDLRGESRQAIITLPSAVDFGGSLSCEVEEVDTVIVVSNGGTLPATITAASVAPPFYVVAPDFPAEIPAGSDLDIHVRYAPAGPGVFADDLLISYESGECSSELIASLRCVVEDAELIPSATVLDFGLLDGCTDRRDTTIVLRNNSPTDITIEGMTLPNGFELLNPGASGIPSGDSITLQLRFRPTANGAYASPLLIATEPCDGTVQIDLRGEKRGVSFTLPDTLDFGELVSCAGSELLLPLPILYNGDDVGSVQSVEITGPFTTTLASGTTLPAREEQRFTVTFTPTGEGSFEGILRVVLQPCDLERTIVLRGRATTFELSGADYDFGLLPSGSQVTGDVIIRNTGSSTAHVEQVDGIIPPFTLLGTTPPLPVDLLPGDELRISIRFDVLPGGSASPLGAVTTTPCADTLGLNLTGEGEVIGRTIVGLPSLSAAPGEDVRLDVLLLEASDLDAAGANRWRAEVSFDRTLLTVADGTPWRDQNEERIVTIEGDRVGPLTLRGGVDLTATLGRAESTPLTLRSFTWLDPDYEVATERRDGLFTLEGLCRDGGVRLFNPEGRIAIRSVTPNPVSGRMTIEYELSESGSTRLAMVDLQGREVGVIFDGPFIPGGYRLSFDARSIPSGTYWLVLTTPTLRVSERVEVVE